LGDAFESVNVDLSIVIPIFNEGENIDALYKELVDVLSALAVSAEL